MLTDFGSLSDDEVSAVALEPDGKIVAAGQSDAGGFQRDFALARHNSDGSLDPSFGSGGKVLTDFGDFEFARSVATEPNGKIVAAGVSSVGVSDDFALARYLAR